MIELTDKQKKLIETTSKPDIEKFYQWISDMVYDLDVIYEKAQHETFGYLVNELDQYKQLMKHRDQMTEVRDMVAIVIEYLEASV